MRRTVTPFTIFAAIAILAASCAPHKVLPPTEASPPHSWHWVDLHAGWRVRVVTPVTRSGSFLVKAEPVPEARVSPGSAQATHRTAGAALINLKAGKDLIGYEVALYSVKPRRGRGVRVSFRSAAINIDGKNVARPHPVLPLFRLPRNYRSVRILHLAWGRHGDHDAAVLAVSRREQLDALTRKVEFHASACVDRPGSLCSWVPAGVAVILEHKKSSGDNSQWTPAY
jgi:hypothetical protein